MKRSETEGLRLQKFLAERGIASRRKAAELIAAGRVTVNAETVYEAGIRIEPAQDVVTYDGIQIAAEKPTFRTIKLHKPRGVVCSTRGQRAPTIYDLLGDRVTERLVPAGRLDKASEGLLLMSNDGDLIARLTHPRHAHSKHYQVCVRGTVSAQQLRLLQSPLKIDGYRIRPAQVAIEWEEPWETALSFVLYEGRNRQIRNMCEQAGLRIQRLIRREHAGIRLGNLAPGTWTDLTPDERNLLTAQPAQAATASA